VFDAVRAAGFGEQLHSRLAHCTNWTHGRTDRRWAHDLRNSSAARHFLLLRRSRTSPHCFQL